MRNLFGYSRVLAIGDIHGMYDKLIALMDEVRFDPAEDLLVCLGDYVDRGTQSLECLDYVMDLQQHHPERVIALLGNHEFAMLDYFEFRTGSGLMWLDNGGQATLRQFLQLPDTELKKRFRWISGLPICYQKDNFYFCHAGIDPYYPLAEQRKKDLLWIRQKFFFSYHGNETIVVGHTPVQYVLSFPSGVPIPLFLPNNIMMCDTGAYLPDGKLSCVDVLSRKVWQA